VAYRLGAGLFNAGCNEQVFSPKPWKKIRADPSCRFPEKRKKRTLQLRKITSPSRRLLLVSGSLKLTF